MKKSTYHIELMDCSAEEQLVRMALQDIPGIEGLEFDLPSRHLVVYHSDGSDAIWESLESLGLGAQREGEAVEAEPDASAIVSQTTNEKRPLVWALAINAVLFVGEIIAGLIAGSMGLVADSLDMLADAFVYSLSLAAVGGTLLLKKRLARWSGYLQFSLAVLGIAEVSRRLVTEVGIPDVVTMIIVASIALAGNLATLAILKKARTGEAHVEASWIFTSNDVKVNILVIASAVVVVIFESKLPDLIAGALIFLIVANGARRILALLR